MLRAGPPALVDPCTRKSNPSHVNWPATPKWAGEEGWGGREAGRGGEVTRVITDLTVGPDGHRGCAIYIGRGGASSQEALVCHGRQGPLEGILEGCTSEEAPKVLTGDSEICWFQKSMELLIWKMLFSQLVHEIALEVCKYDLCFHYNYFKSNYNYVGKYINI